MSNEFDVVVVGGGPLPGSHDGLLADFAAVLCARTDTSLTCAPPITRTRAQCRCPAFLRGPRGRAHIMMPVHKAVDEGLQPVRYWIRRAVLRYLRWRIVAELKRLDPKAVKGVPTNPDELLSVMNDLVCAEGHEDGGDTEYVARTGHEAPGLHG